MVHQQGRTQMTKTQDMAHSIRKMLVALGQPEYLVREFSDADIIKFATEMMKETKFERAGR
jgi:hypothetical protein